jgi:3-oxoacyl-[acyl-carrier-protein] synthase II
MRRSEVQERIVITGAGVVSSVGMGVQQFVESLWHSNAQAASGPIPDFQPERWLGSKGIRTLDRGTRMLCVASQMALAESGYTIAEAGSARAGLVCGSMLPGLHSIIAFDWSGITDGPTYVNPSEFPNTVLNSAAGQAAIRCRLRGANATIVAGTASGLHALEYAARTLRLGRADFLVAGGYEEYGEELRFGFEKNCPATHPRGAAWLSEGCALVALERLPAALERGATFGAEICGFGAAQHDPAASDGQVEAAAGAVQQSLAASAITPDEIGCIVLGDDAVACAALQALFSARLSHIPAFAVNSRLGETLGAGGAFAALVGAISLSQGVVPPSGPSAMPSELSISERPQTCDCEYALVLALGCDGNFASLVLRKCPSQPPS